jgi:DnaJ like chaperone protein
MGVKGDDRFGEQLRHIIAAVLGAGASDERQELAVELMFRLLGHVARIDGGVAPQEAALVRGVLVESRMPAGLRERATAAFSGRGATPLDLRAELEPLLEAFPPGSEELVALFENVLVLARSDGRVDAAERAFLVELASALGVPITHLDRRLKDLGNPSLH